jgi:tetratricopeptide (TPR) repeat protein
LAGVWIAGCATDPTSQAISTGWQQLETGQPERALQTADSILAQSPASPRAAEMHYLRGRALEAQVAASPNAQQQQLTEAHAAYTAALQKGPSDALAGQIFAGIANTFYWQDDFTSAWRNWLKAYDLTPDTDPATKGYVLYRIGLCQQRLGQFEEADRTFAAVVEQFPGTDAAARARQKAGWRGFAVQVATFASAQNAENAMNALRRDGFIPSRNLNAQGQTVVMVEPFADYQQARIARTRLAGLFPDALIVP